MYRIEKLERNQANISDFTRDVDTVLGGFEQRITTKIKTKQKDGNTVSLTFLSVSGLILNCRATTPVTHQQINLRLQEG
jgi:hypothetical protein